MCDYSAEKLIGHAAEMGYEVLSITCHDVDVWTGRLSDYAAGLGITLIPGMEVTTEGTCHTLVYNFDSDPGDLDTLEKIGSRAGDNTLVIAPHTYFPDRSSLRGLLEQNLDVFDAIEYSGFYLRAVDFNRRSRKIAEKARKPLIGCGDIHYLWQLNRTFAWIYSEPEATSVIKAVKQGLVRLETAPLSWMEAAGWWATTFWRHTLAVTSHARPASLSRKSHMRMQQ